MHTRNRIEAELMKERQALSKATEQRISRLTSTLFGRRESQSESISISIPPASGGGGPHKAADGKATVFANHLADVHRRVRTFADFMKWYCEDTTFPFAMYWVRELLGIKIDNHVAQGMLEEQVRVGARCSAVEEDTMRSANAYCKIEDSLMSHMTRIFLCIQSALADGRSASQASTPSARRGAPTSPSTSWRHKGKKASTLSPVHVLGPTSGKEEQLEGQFSGVPFEKSVAESDTLLPTGPQVEPVAKDEQQRSSTNLVNFGIARVLCQPGAASPRAALPVFSRPPCISTSDGNSPIHQDSPVHQDKHPRKLRRNKTDAPCGIAATSFDAGPPASVVHSIRPPSSAIESKHGVYRRRPQTGPVGANTPAGGISHRPKNPTGTVVHVATGACTSGQTLPTSDGWTVLRNDALNPPAVATSSVSAPFKYTQTDGRVTWTPQQDTQWVSTPR